MLPVRYRMTRSTDFGTTVSQGMRAVQPDVVVHARRGVEPADGPRIGFVVAKSVGNAVQRHRVARRLRHAARAVLDDLEAGDRLVVRARPSCRDAITAGLEAQLHDALQRIRARGGAPR